MNGEWGGGARRKIGEGRRWRKKKEKREANLLADFPNSAAGLQCPWSTASWGGGCALWERELPAYGPSICSSLYQRGLNFLFRSGPCHGWIFLYLLDLINMIHFLKNLLFIICIYYCFKIMEARHATHAFKSNKSAQMLRAGRRRGAKNKNKNSCAKNRKS